MTQTTNRHQRITGAHRQNRELAVFYQNQINALNVAPLQAWSTTAVFVSVAALLISTVSPLSLQGKEWTIMGAIVTGMALALWSKHNHCRQAEAIEARYLKEQAELFPELPPIPLVGFLLEKRRHKRNDKLMM